MPLEACHGVYDQRKIDKRWVRIRRPTLVVGGELTMSSLEVTLNTSTGICEAPLQMKSNCGTLVIDDFGRQRMRIDELLNRWILPLEKRYDFLNLPNGKKIEVPFDQLIIFSTNLEPRNLVDEAFLRRIPYKIEITDPTEDEFRDLFKRMASKLGFDFRPEPIEYLLDKHYRAVNRPFRFCHPRDLLLQVRSFCLYKSLPAGNHRGVPRAGGGELLRGDVSHRARPLDPEGKLLLRVVATVRRQFLEQQAGLDVACCAGTCRWRIR